MSEIKIDLKDCVKYMVKLYKEVRRKKKMLYSFSFALVNGFIYFLVAQNNLILLIFSISLSIFLCNLIAYVCNLKYKH
jgi:hypothetical protein